MRSHVDFLAFVARYEFNRKFRPSDLIDGCDSKFPSEALLKCGLRGEVGKIFEAGRNADQTYFISDLHFGYSPRPRSLSMPLLESPRATRVARASAPWTLAEGFRTS